MQVAIDGWIVANEGKSGRRLIQLFKRGAFVVAHLENHSRRCCIKRTSALIPQRRINQSARTNILFSRFA
jgi:hypothetical protein